MQDELLIDIREVARLLGVCERTIAKLQRLGEIPGQVRLGRAVRWRRDTIVEWVREKASKLSPGIK